MFLFRKLRKKNEYLIATIKQSDATELNLKYGDDVVILTRDQYYTLRNSNHQTTE